MNCESTLITVIKIKHDSFQILNEIFFDFQFPKNLIITFIDVYKCEVFETWFSLYFLKRPTSSPNQYEFLNVYESSYLIVLKCDKSTFLDYKSYFILFYLILNSSFFLEEA